MKTRFACLLLLPGIVWGADQEKAKVEAEPTVETVTVHQREFHPETEMIGLVATPPNAALKITLPVEVKVRLLMIHRGQSVKAGDPLVEIEPPLDFQVAQSAAEMTAQTLDSAQKRFELRLISIADLLTARQAAAEARLRLSHYTSSGLSADGHQLLTSTGGVIAEIPATPGDTIAAGELIAQMIVSDALVVKGGIVPEAEIEVAGKANVETLSRVTSISVEGEVQSVGRALNAETHLLDVTVRLPEPGGLHVGEAVRVGLPGAARTAVLVPKAALRSEEGETLVFTVKDKKAVRHVVEIGASEGDEVEVISGGVRDGDVVVTTGNSQLTDAMAVEIKGTETKPSEEEK